VNPTLSALLICIMAAALEGALAGSGVRQRLTALRMPRYSPPFTFGLLIGLVYYPSASLFFASFWLRIQSLSRRVWLSRCSSSFSSATRFGASYFFVVAISAPASSPSFPTVLWWPRWSSRSRAFIRSVLRCLCVIALPAVCHVVGLSFVATQHPET